MYKKEFNKLNVEDTKLYEKCKNYYYESVDNYLKNIMIILVIIIHQELVHNEKRRKGWKEYEENYKVLISTRVNLKLLIMS